MPRPRYEADTRTKGKSGKFIFIKDEERKDIFVITGDEGK